MVKKLNENGRLVYDYVMTHEDENITTADIAEATGIAKKSVEGIVTMTFVRNTVKDDDGNKTTIPLMERVAGEAVVDENGKAKLPKYIKMTDAGREIEIENKD